MQLLETALFAFCPAGKPGGTGCLPYRLFFLFAVKTEWKFPFVLFFAAEIRGKIVRAAPRAARVNRGVAPCVPERLTDENNIKCKNRADYTKSTRVAFCPAGKRAARGAAPYKLIGL